MPIDLRAGLSNSGMYTSARQHFQSLVYIVFRIYLHKDLRLRRC